MWRESKFSDLQSIEILNAFKIIEIIKIFKNNYFLDESLFSHLTLKTKDGQLGNVQHDAGENPDNRPFNIGKGKIQCWCVVFKYFSKNLLKYFYWNLLILNRCNSVH